MKYTPEEQQQIDLLNLNSYNFTRFKNPSENVQQYAVSLRGDLIHYIKNPSSEVQRLAISNDGVAAYYIANPANDLLDNPEVIRSIKRTIAAMIKTGINEDVIIRYLERVSRFNIPELEKIEAAIVKHRALSRKSITESRDLNSMSKRKQIAAVKRNGNAIRYIQNPSLEVQLAAVKKDGYAIQYIQNPSLEVQLVAVEQDGYAIEYIQNPSLEVQLVAVEQDGYAIQYIQNPSLEVQLAAVKENGHAIEYIQNPSEPVQLAAVKQNSYAIQYIRNPSLAVQLAAVEQDVYAIKYIQNTSPDLFARLEVKHIVIRYLLSSIKSGYSIDVILEYLDRHLVDWPELEKIRAVAKKKPITESSGYDSMSEEEQINLVEYLPYSISKITNPSERVQLAAVSIEGDVIKYIPNPSKEVKLAAVRNRGRAIAYIEDPDEDIKRTAVTENGYSIRYISNPSLLIQMTAIDDTSDAIRYIKNPTEQIQLYAVNKASYSIEDIEFPTKRVQRTAILTNAECIRLIRNIDVELFDDPKIKTAIIKEILELVKENSADLVLHILRILNGNNVDWPEMERLNKIPDIMERKPITETLDFDSMSEEEQIRKVFATYGYAIRSIRDPSERVQLAAVQLNGFLIQFIYQKGIEPSDRVKKAAVENAGNAIAYIPNPSEELQIAAVRTNGDAIAQLQKDGIKPSRRVKEEAVRAHPWSIIYIDQPDDNLQRLALMNDPLLIPRIPGINLSLLEETSIRRQIIKGLLQSMISDNFNHRTAENAISFLETHGIQWTELEKIKSVLIRKGIS